MNFSLARPSALLVVFGMWSMLSVMSFDWEREHPRIKFHWLQVWRPIAVHQLTNSLLSVKWGNFSYNECKFIIVQMFVVCFFMLKLIWLPQLEDSPLLSILNCIPFINIELKLSIPFCCLLWDGGDRWWWRSSLSIHEDGGECERSFADSLLFTFVGVTWGLLLFLMRWWLLLMEELFRLRSKSERMKPRFAAGTWQSLTSLCSRSRLIDTIGEYEGWMGGDGDSRCRFNASRCISGGLVVVMFWFGELAFWWYMLHRAILDISIALRASRETSGLWEPVLVTFCCFRV